MAITCLRACMARHITRCICRIVPVAERAPECRTAKRVDAPEVLQVVRNEGARNLFTVDIERLRAALEKITVGGNSISP